MIRNFFFIFSALFVTANGFGGLENYVRFKQNATKLGKLNYASSSFDVHFLAPGQQYDGNYNFGQKVCNRSLQLSSFRYMLDEAQYDTIVSAVEKANDSSNLAENLPTVFNRRTKLLLFWRCEGIFVCECPLGHPSPVRCCLPSHEADHPSDKNGESNNRQRKSVKSGKNGGIWIFVMFIIFISICIAVCKETGSSKHRNNAHTISPPIVLPPPVAPQGDSVVYQIPTGAVAYNVAGNMDSTRYRPNPYPVQQYVHPLAQRSNIQMPLNASHYAMSHHSNQTNSTYEDSAPPPTYEEAARMAKTAV